MKPIANIKCPFCVGQTNKERKTLYLYSTDTYWCARCKASGLVSALEPSQLANLTISTKQPKQTSFQYNNKGERFSVCKQRFSDATKDVFQIKLPDGSLVGHYTRYPNKQSHIEGVKGFCYREQFMYLGITYRV